MTKKILVADESITIQKIVAMAFENEDSLVEGISNGKDALDRIKNFNPNIVLADVNMAELSGFELSKIIKNDPKFHSIKVLLLASDLEDFNKNLFDSSGADDYISKPFKSQDIIRKVTDLILDITPGQAKETIELTAVNLDEAIKPTEATIELSAENLTTETEATIELSAENLITEDDLAVEPSSSDLEKPIAFVSAKEMPLETVVTTQTEEDILDVMINDLESFEESSDSTTNFADELSAEAPPSQEDKIGDELDIAFQEIANFAPQGKLKNLPNIELKPINEHLSLDNIIPEPEDLLGEMTPSTLGGKKGLARPDLIKESLSYITELPREPKSINYSSCADDDQFSKEKIKHSLEDMINTSVEKEIAKLGESIRQSVIEVVREIIPRIAREIIIEEIEKIKKP
jgi:CheY-like chemotaxis protein